MPGLFRDTEYILIHMYLVCAGTIFPLEINFTVKKSYPSFLLLGWLSLCYHFYPLKPPSYTDLYPKNLLHFHILWHSRFKEGNINKGYVTMHHHTCLL